MEIEFEKAGREVGQIVSNIVDAQKASGLNETADAANELRAAAQKTIRLADHLMSMATVLEHSI